MSSNLLENLKDLKQIKDMSVEQLKTLSDELRQALIYNISNTGGHLASNLGVVELTVAIHKVFDSPDDQIVFDVGHQCYVHKMLTGRYNEFTSLRKKDGLSGFPNPSESKHDIFKTGHSSTSISSALGLAYSKSISNKNSSTVAVIGDGSITGGLAYEGLNNAGTSGKNLVVILNDNKMSISKNVGSISKTLTKLRNKSGYFKTKDAFAHAVLKIPCIGKPLYRRFFRLKSAVKSYFYSPNIFESMGLKYIGPVDGHNLEVLIRVLERAKALKCPVLVHVKTTKGKGYTFAEDKPHEFHGVSKFDIGTGASDNSSKISFSDVFGKTIVSLAESNSSICAITAAMGDSCGLSLFKERFPDKYFDVGIAEQHAVTFASGLAKNGMVPVFSVYSTFLQRAYDQIIHDVSLQKLKMVFAVDRAGFVGNDGETHQGLFDIPMFLPIPDIKIFAPANGTELENFLERAIETEEYTSVVRYPKGDSVFYSDYPFKSSNDWEFVTRHSKTLFVTYGVQVYDVLNAALKFNADVLKLNLINNFDDKLVSTLCEYPKIIFIEEGYSVGGVSMLMSSVLMQNNFKGDYKVIALNNDFYKHSERGQSLEDNGLAGEYLEQRIMELI